MLDECKGEKLEEVLVSFSSCVLQKVLANEKDGGSAVARKIALASKLSQTDQKSLLPLAVAHRAALDTLLHRKEQLRRRYRSFQDELDGRKQELQRHTNRLKQDKKSSGEVDVPEDAIQKAKKKLSLHWHGDLRWLDVLFDGDQSRLDDQPFVAPFEQTWKQVTTGRISKESVAEKKGLVQDLQTRLELQKARLQQWRQFCDELTNERQTVKTLHPIASESFKGLDMKFRDQLGIILDPRKAQNSISSHEEDLDRSSDTGHFLKLIDSLRQDIHHVDEPKVRKNSQHASARRPRPTTGPILKKANATDKDAGPTTEQKILPRTSEEGQRYFSQDNGNNANASAQLSCKDEDVFSVESKRGDRSRLSESSQRMSVTSFSPSRSASSRPKSGIKGKKLDTPKTDHDEDDVLAAEIVSLSLNAESFPVKNKTSLAERTRQSMNFLSTYRAPLDDDPIMQPSLPRVSRLATSSKPAISIDGKTTLLERARQSMSLIPKEPRKAAHKHRSSMVFPTNPFETPSKQITTSKVLDETTPPEQLFSDDVEYTSVFKSRPKIAMSPVPSHLVGEFSSLEVLDEDGVG